MDAKYVENYRLSSQQCGIHAAHWQSMAPINVVLAEGPTKEIQPEALRRALDRMIERHEILRMRYRAVTGLRYPLQHVVPELSPAWTIFDEPISDEELVHAARSFVDLRNGPVIGAALTTSSEGRLRWALAAPSYSLDATSIQELAMSCVDACMAEGRMADAGETVQYPDYVAWQSELFASGLGREGAHFWEMQMATPGYPLRLPFEGEATGWRGPAQTLALTNEANEAIAMLVKRLGLPAESVLLGLWAGFLARIAQTDSLSFDWHFGARAEELKTALGCFAMKLPVSVHLNLESPVDVIIRSVADQLQAITSWQECFDAAAFLDGLAREGKVRHGVEFAHVPLLDLPNGWACRHVDLDPSGARLICRCIETNGAYMLQWQGTNVYAAETVKAWMRQFAALLEGVRKYPEAPWSHLSMLDNAEREQILHGFHSERKPHEQPSQTLHSLFEAQAKRRPDALAVICGERRLTYQELDIFANRLARRLQERGVGAELAVGVHLGRSVDAIVAILGAMKAGATYVPLDPAYPMERTDYMVMDAGVSTIIAETRDLSRFLDLGPDLICVDELGEWRDEPLLHNAVDASNLAYLIYTSGSTGRPKGVMVSHANAVASTTARFDFYPEPVSHFLLLSSLSFDSSVAGIFWTLGQGGMLHIPSDDLYQDPARIAELIAREKISHVLTLPSFYKQILDSLTDGSSLRCAVVAGEACHADVVEKHRRCAPGAALVNEYGPTEGTVWSNAFRIEADPIDGLRIPIGHPIPSMRGYVFDDRLELCPIGMPGEWYIGGDGITRGYRGQPALTARRFVADPFGSGERLYRTGDRVRLRSDGKVEYLGRVDNQVKLRGHRIELGEIEEILLAHERIREAVVMVHDDSDLGQRLLAYVVADVEGETQALRETLTTCLRQRLPAFMVPTHVVLVPRFPLMPNGKLDRQALLVLGEQGGRSRYVAPTNEIERALAEIWQTVLKVDRVGLEDSFFELGGHSLLATQVTSRVRQTLAVDVPLRELFETATLGELAARVQGHIDAGRSELALMERLLADAEASR